MNNIEVLGIDLAKNVFQVYCADSKGNCVLKKRLSRDKLTDFMANLSPCLVGMEACGSAHYWARKFELMGHTVRLMAPQFVKPYIKSNKNDDKDSEGIAEAVTRPTMKFVPIKSIEQQDILMLHRARELVIKQRTAQGNQIRGLLAEYGIILPKSINHLRTKFVETLENNAAKLTVLAKATFQQLYEQFISLDKIVKNHERQLEQIASESPQCQQLLEIEGVGLLTATAAVASIGNPNAFKNGREVSAWLGLVPKQHSSGEKIVLGSISKRGDRYLRTLLIHGARAVINHCHKKIDPRSQWILSKKNQKGTNVAAVALANKNVRIIWAMLSSGECYRKHAVS
jgi:transposase